MSMSFGGGVAAEATMVYWKTGEADYVQASEPATPVEGETWCDTDDDTLFVYFD